jgi:glycosyltransferase involved in cell wall biosynthesis
MLLAAEAGVVVPPADPIRLAAAIKNMLDQPDTASEMGLRGREFIEATLSWDAIVGAWLDGLSARLSSQSVLS